MDLDLEGLIHRTSAQRFRDAGQPRLAANVEGQLALRENVQPRLDAIAGSVRDAFWKDEQRQIIYAEAAVQLAALIADRDKMARHHASVAPAGEALQALMHRGGPDGR